MMEARLHATTMAIFHESRQISDGPTWLSPAQAEKLAVAALAVADESLLEVIRRAHYACTKSSLTADERVFDATAVLSRALGQEA